MQFTISTRCPPSRDDLIQGAIKQAPLPLDGWLRQYRQQIVSYNSELLQRIKKFPITSAGPVFLHLDSIQTAERALKAGQDDLQHLNN
ncbi:hypothetical protein JCM10213v2_001611 [Rhodosporidiobolus nylandii]